MAETSRDPEYLAGLPENTRLKASIQSVIEQYSGRDRFISEFRDAEEGKNPVAAPKSLQYKVVVSHTYHLQAIINEKRSRYKRLPEIKVIPFTDFAQDRTESEELEAGMNLAISAIDANSDGHFWEFAVKDQLTLDMGAIRVERAPAAFWPKLIPGPGGKNELERIHEDPKAYEKAAEKYKKAAGIPIRAVHVPVSRIYPVKEGANYEEVYEFEERSLRSVLANGLFDREVLKAHMPSRGNDGGLSQKIVIMHYANHEYHAYYALGPSHLTRQMWPTTVQTSTLAQGDPILLHAYKHHLGRPDYVIFTGRGSGWAGGNDIDGVMRALLDLNRDADELRSQVLTFVRNTLWPTRVAYYDPEKRGEGPDGGPPNPPKITEGETIAMFNGERIENITASIPDFKLAEWLYTNTTERMAELAGSPAVFGTSQPGVYTGYHQQRQISQAEHLDSMIESSQARGAVELATLVAGHIKAMEEDCYVHQYDPQARDGKVAKFLTISPKQLEPMPIFAAKVRDTSPVEILTAAQAALQLTQIRPGHDTPLMDDSYVRSEILGVSDSPAMERRILEQNFRWKTLLRGEVVFRQIGVKLGMLLAQDEGAAVSDEVVGDAAPSFLDAAMSLGAGGETMGAGGMDPMVLQQIINAGGQVPPPPPAPEVPTSGAGGALMGVGGGVPAGNAQPSQVAARTQQALASVMGP